jgi:hypothetical protein
MFLIEVVEKVKTHILCSTISTKNRALYYIMWKKYGRTRQATDDNKLYCEAEEMRFARRISKQITGK